MRVTLQEELDQLEASLQEEGAHVLRALRGALNALLQSDIELADEVIAFDDEVDETYLGIEEGIQSLLARQTPVAVDLRLVRGPAHQPSPGADGGLLRHDRQVDEARPGRAA